MKRFAISFVLIVGLIAAITLGAAMLQPDVYSVERSTTINVAPANVYSVISDFRRFEDWSPWEKYDRAMQKEYSGSPAQEGSTYSWKGNGKVGEGLMTIVSLVPNEKVEIKLEFFKPWADTSTTTWNLKPEGEGRQTQMTWVMQGKRHNVLAKAIGMIVPMDRMIGKDFEEGLANLKSRLEQDAPASPAPQEAATDTN